MYEKFAGKYVMTNDANHQDEIFAVRTVGKHYKISNAQKHGACQQFGARVCTLSEMTSAQQRNGAQWCACSMVSDSTSSFYPMQSGGPGGCGGPVPGVRNCGWHSDQNDVCCIKDVPLTYERFAGPYKMSNDANFNDEIFAVRATGHHYKVPEAQEHAACKAHGARVCTSTEMTLAQQNNGAQWCACSHVSDSVNSFYPMQSGGPGGCGGPVPGVRNCGSHPYRDVCCVKEAIPVYQKFTSEFKLTGSYEKGAVVFGVRDQEHYKIPESKEDEACAAHGARVCTLAQMTQAQQNNKAQWCACSHVSDSANSFYPMQSGGPGGCGGPIPGVRNCGSYSYRDVCCYKEPKMNYQIFAGPYTMGGYYSKHQNKQIFAVRDSVHYTVAKKESQAACSKFGARVCTHSEMTEAQQKHSAQWCACSIVSDSTSTFYPMQSGGPGGCGGPVPGVRNCGTHGDQSDVCCVRETAPAYEVFSSKFTTANGNKVFAVRDSVHYTIPREKENAACAAHGARVCTLSEMTVAQQSHGAQWCACSHVSDSDNTFYPMQSGGSGGCGGPVPGVRNCGAHGNKADVCCVQEATPTYQKFAGPFTLSSHSSLHQHDKIFPVRLSGQHYKLGQAQKEQACGAYNAEVCTLAQMTEGQQNNKAQWCACSMVSDSTSTFYPMQSGGPGGCGGPVPGVRNCGAHGDQSDVCCIEKVDTHKYERFGVFKVTQAPNIGAEIFAVRDQNHYTIPVSEKHLACSALSARVCTLAEMTSAQTHDGAQWCACSHVSDSDSNSFYPMQKGGSGGCGGPSAGVRTCSGGFRDVCCIKMP